jgi:hypothetical protein
MSATVHSALPAELERQAGAVLAAAGVRHIAHGDGDDLGAAAQAAADEHAVALLGPFTSRAVAEALEATAPAGLPLLAPMATWAGVTRPDEPGAEIDPADPRGTVLRMVARDTEVARRIAAHVRQAGQRAFVVAGRWEYGDQLDRQLELGGLPRAGSPAEADLVVVAGVADEPGMEAAAATAPLPVIAFDGAQGLDLGSGRDVLLALAFAEDLSGAREAAGAARLVTAALAAGAATRAEVLAACRAAGPFDEHGDPVDPPVWLWRADAAWRLAPERAI